ncbi:Rieske 2Fe-2S domain-containing protein, partial [Nitrospira sp. BLG_2]|uniref:Rieske 2Fe-2S domain-containing protein n=1 Tax=Nitrospira sp. BLG_2 TaxID=3397507 RepID=UPI003B9D62C7
MEGGSGPDFSKGVSTDRLSDGGMLLGHIGQEDVILARRGGEFFAVGATCSHYSGPLIEGLMLGDELRCPWHHACFSLRTGEALRAPAFDAIPCWRVERIGETVFVREKLS